MSSSSFLTELVPAGDLGDSSTHHHKDVLLWTPTSNFCRPSRAYIHVLGADFRCTLEDLLGAMDDWDGWREWSSGKSMQSAGLDENFYQQKFGWPMGSLLSCVFACLFLEFIEFGTFGQIITKMLATVVEGNPKAPFSIATTPKPKIRVISVILLLCYLYIHEITI